MGTKATGSSSSLKLHFKNHLPGMNYTLTNIKDNNNEPLQLILADANNVEALTNNLPSLKVELVVLEGDFDSNDGNWSSQEFERKMVKPRPGKRPLLVGKTTAYLRDGSVVFPAISFTDNSSWDKSGNFRIGARVVPGSYKGPRIKEAFTDPFRVKDRRGREYEKHDPPALSDDVWRLEKIRKRGIFHTNLASYNINTVQDFLKLLFIDEPMLRSILGGRISDQTWVTITNHAKKCVIGNGLYLHRGDQLKIVVNSVCQVEKIILPDNRVFTPNELSSKAYTDLVKDLAREAYENWDRLEEYHGPPNTDIPLPSNAEMAQGAMDSLLFDLGQGCDFTFQSPFGDPIDPLP
ncbi:protein SAR DEFICIENT 1-like [Curcuma longa]|uniref:protein SAR DEFICIENT 1-like n=1 Tax=Curcuma longa TaxID=136217 RepID=UPI003D9E5F53